MKAAFSSLASFLIFSFVLSLAAPSIVAQSRPQRPVTTKTGDGKKNDRPTAKTEE